MVFEDEAVHLPTYRKHSRNVCPRVGNAHSFVFHHYCVTNDVDVIANEVPIGEQQENSKGKQQDVNASFVPRSRKCASQTPDPTGCDAQTALLQGQKANPPPGAQGKERLLYGQLRAVAPTA
ncbi:hypothetical protein GO988_23090 [Hymenobacter sp. HMF4947]|uniref:Uncharacterized protein n=1 Tax=Hymenobacter ginkgonis TaxID=2682976 RepID=A0A7K1TLD2_9BACT|nr:hypothetical protein [Hymenobacter ginkgonis]MVN79228.1 hypothetical protein [Hymenobacter ginkgonis]